MEECWLTNFMAWIAYEFPYPGFVMSNYPQRRSDLTQMHMRKKDKKESLMVSQCANPECLRELRYLHDGKIYAFAVSAGNGSKSLEHFWLCGGCSKSMTLICLNQPEVKTAWRRKVTSLRGPQRSFGNGATE